MLLLPTVEIAGKKIQLPCSSANLLKLIAAVSKLATAPNETNEEPFPGGDLELRQVLCHDPLLYLFATARLQEEPCNHRAHSWAEQIVRYVLRPDDQVEFLDPAIVSLIKRQRQFRLQRKLVKYWKRPNHKRIAKFAAPLMEAINQSRMDTAEIKDWLKAKESEPKWKVSEQPVAHATARAKTEIDHLFGAEIDSQSVSLMWQSVARQARLSQEFQRQLRIEKLESLRQLAYGASHEINNPLANIATRAQSLIQDEGQPERRRRLALIYDQAIRAHEMISDMMLFARPPELTRQTTNLRALCRELVGPLQQRGLQCSIRVYPDVVPLSIDPSQIKIAIGAILQNSWDAIGPGAGHVRIRLFRHCTHSIGISIVDSGPGIDSDVARHLFDPFYSGREAGRGSGFGLSKAWQIITSHQGRLECDFSWTDGAKFDIRLPIRQNSACRIDTARAA